MDGGNYHHHVGDYHPLHWQAVCHHSIQIESQRGICYRMYHDSSQSPLLTSTFAIQGDLSLSNKEIIERLARLEEGQKASVDKLEYRKINKSEIRIPACMA